MESIGLQVNTRLNVLLCASCQSSVLPDQVQAHFRNNHKDSKTKVDKAAIETSRTALTIMDGLPALDGGPYLEFAGLAVHDGLVCGACPKIYGTVASLKKHYSKKHAQTSVPSEFAPTQCQRLCNGLNRNYFAIIPANVVPTEPTEDIIKDLRELVEVMWAEDDAALEYDPRQVNPWLRTTKWHEHVKGYKTEDLRALVAQPSKDDFPELKDAVVALLRHSMGTIAKVPELSLQKLNTSDPAKT